MILAKCFIPFKAFHVDFINNWFEKLSSLKKITKSSFYRLENWDPERLNDLSITQSYTISIQTQIVFFHLL